MNSLTEAPRRITGVEIDCHRWYCIVTTTYEYGEADVTVIGTQNGDGLGTYASVDEWDKAVN